MDREGWWWIFVLLLVLIAIACLLGPLPRR